MIKLDKKLMSRLNSYMLAGGALTVVKAASAGIVYTDINPDYNGGVSDTYSIDLNNDGTADFEIEHDGSNLFINPLAYSNEVLGSNSGNFVYPYALNQSAAISAGASGNWNNNGYSIGYNTLNYMTYFGTQFGNWFNVADKYLGLRFKVGANTYYGWARLTVSANGDSWVVKDYAYEDVAGASIAAGAMVSAVMASGAQNVMATDIANNSNGTDLQVSFDAGLDETTISEYRAHVVKAANAASFDLTAAMAVPSGNYTTVLPTGLANYSTIFNAGATDVDGNLIENGVDYSIFVHSVADGTNATVDSLSLPASVTLHLPVDVPANVVATDLDDVGDPSDLQVSFDAAANEATISEYRIMVLKETTVPLFNESLAQLVPASNYVAVSPTGQSSYVHDFASSAVDVTGSLLEQGVEYRAFVFSVADGAIAINDSLSAPSAIFQLRLPADAAANVAGSDVADNNNGTDLQVSFDAAPNEGLISEYRIIAVKDANSAAFDLTTALALPATNYTTLLPDGSAQYTTVLGSGATDSDGDAIKIGENYRIFILSARNTTLAHTDALSAPSGSVMLNIQADIASNITGTDISDNHDASDVEVSFDAALNENRIGAYSIMVVPASDAATFDLATASSVLAGNYHDVVPNASPDYTAILSPSTNDVNGSAITEGVEYAIFILSRANGTDANLDSLSAPSENFTIENTVGVDENPLAYEIAVVQRDNHLHISISGGLSETIEKVELYDLTGKRVISQTSSNSGLATVNTLELSQGVYVLVVGTSFGEKGQKVFIK